MAFSLLTLLDDITLLADDVAALSKVAAKKTAGVLGDDIALNAHQVSGIRPSRELPVIWAVAKGSALNKAIIVPVALLLVTFFPWAITPLLMLGGAYLCFEGAEKVFHAWLHTPAEDEAHHQELIGQIGHGAEERVMLEREKIKGAIRTDFILSAEIIVISLGSMQSASFAEQAISLVVIAVLFTIGVYLLVAGVVKLDDLGLYLSQTGTRLKRWLGLLILRGTPYLLKSLSFIGTAAMFLVGGGIIAHGFHAIQDGIALAATSATAIPALGLWLGAAVPLLAHFITGMLAGMVGLLLVKLFVRFRPG